MHCVLMWCNSPTESHDREYDLGNHFDQNTIIWYLFDAIAVDSKLHNEWTVQLNLDVKFLLFF